MHTPKELATFRTQALEHLSPTPYMLVNTDTIKSRCKEFKKLLPNTQLFYAYKCFSDDEVIRALDSLVDGYDVASPTEINALIRLGVDPMRMAYSNPVKSRADIREAFEAGVRSFAFQSEGELHKLADEARGSRVYFRVRVDDEASAIAFSSKFGGGTQAAVDLLVQAKEYGLVPVGVTFHVGSQAENLSVWETALKVCQGIIALCKDRGVELSLVNIGGGFPVQYKKTDPSLELVANQVRSSISEYVPGMSTMAEPGRNLVADSAVIVTTVIGVEDRGEATWLFLDTGTFQSFLEVFEFGYFPYPVYSLRHENEQHQDTATKQYVLTGPSCDSYDTMTQSISLPNDIREGDQLMIGMAGAYTVVYGSDFNGFSVPKRHFFN